MPGPAKAMRSPKAARGSWTSARATSRATGRLAGNPLPQANAYAMIQRRAQAAEITTKIGNHTFRATRATAFLKKGGTLERAGRWRTTRARGRHSFTIAAPRK
jgi:integrase